jgi:hypothetical protein
MKCTTRARSNRSAQSTDVRWNPRRSLACGLQWRTSGARHQGQSHRLFHSGEVVVSDDQVRRLAVHAAAASRSYSRSKPLRRYRARCSPRPRLPGDEGQLAGRALAGGVVAVAYVPRQRLQARLRSDDRARPGGVGA